MPRPRKKPTAKRSATRQVVRARVRFTAKRSAKRTRMAKARRPEEVTTEPFLKTTKPQLEEKLARKGQPMPVRARFTDPLRRFGEFENVRGLIESQAKAHGDRTFLVFEDDGREYSYATLDERTSRAARVLRELGVAEGGRVALLMPNAPEFVFVLLGAMKAGLIAVPVRTDLGAGQVRAALEDSGAAVLVVDEDLWPNVSGYFEELPGLMAVLVSGRTESVAAQSIRKDHLNLPRGDACQVISLQGALDAADPAALDARQPRWWDEAAILYTSHDLKSPRGAILQHRQFMTSARWLSVWLGLGPRDKFLNALPLFHANAQVLGVFAPLLLGGTLILSREFNVARVWRAIERYRVNVMAAVPSMLGILAGREVAEARGARGQAAWPSPQESPGALGLREDSEARERGLARAHDISSLRMVVCGAAPLPRTTLKSFEQCFLVPVIEGLSMTETTCFATLNPADGTRRLGSVGLAVGNKVAIQDDGRAPRPLDDNWQPTCLARMSPNIFPTANIGEPGEICVWGENVLKEYFRRPGVNPQAFAGGWFHTGDLGRMDADGFLYVLGQRGQQVQRDGTAFMPREIDEALFTHKSVESAASIAAGDSRRGSLVTTVVVMRRGTFPGGPDDGRMPSDDDQKQQMQAQLKGWMQTDLGEVKQPTTLVFAPRIPQDAAGKTRIFELQKLARRMSPAGTFAPDESEE